MSAPIDKLADRLTTKFGNIQPFRHSEYRLLRYLHKNPNSLFTCICSRLRKNESISNNYNFLKQVFERLLYAKLIKVETLKLHVFRTGIADRAWYNSKSFSVRGHDEFTEIFKLLASIDWLGLKGQTSSVLELMVAINQSPTGIVRVCDFKKGPINVTRLYDILKPVTQRSHPEDTVLIGLVGVVKQPSIDTGALAAHCYLTDQGEKILQTWVEVTNLVDKIIASET